MTGSQKLKKWLDARGMSQQDLANRLGCAQQAVSFWINGDRLPGLSMALALQRVTKIQASSWHSDGAA